LCAYSYHKNPAAASPAPTLTFTLAARSVRKTPKTSHKFHLNSLYLPPARAYFPPDIGGPRPAVAITQPANRRSRMKYIATIASILAGLAVAGAFTVMSTGCCAGGNCAGARATAGTTAVDVTPAASAVETTAPETTDPEADTMDAMDTMSESEESMMMEEAGVHFVLGGESLWSIAALDEVFADPFMWPLLLKSNLDQIEDADLIYPGQELNVPAGDSPSDVALAVEHAKTRGAWFMGLIEATDQEYIRAALQ